MKVLQISKRGLPAEVIELADISEPYAPKAGGLLAAVKIWADHINLWRTVMRAIEAKVVQRRKDIRQVARRSGGADAD
jgi:hypothetical protein